jgi:RNA polymerase sigma factor for flagellar operon FliA
MNTTCATAQRLIEENQGLVRSIAAAIHRKLNASVDLDDLIAYGQVGLGQSARDYDPARGSRFSTYAYYRVRGAIYDGLSKMSWFGRSAPPSQVRYQQMSNEVLQVENEAGGLDESREAREDMRWLRDVSRALTVVYLATQAYSAAEGRESWESTLVDRTSLTAPAAAAQAEINEKLHRLIDALPSAAATLIRAAYFEGLTLQEAGQRIGVSKSWASRLHHRALEQLARGLRLEGVVA